MIDSRRIRTRIVTSSAAGPVLYWMNRDIRVQDNWALLYAQELAHKQGVSLGVFYNLDPRFIDGGRRQVEWKLQSLKEVEEELSTLDIPFCVVVGSGSTVILDCVRSVQASTVVVDFSPLKPQQKWVHDVEQEFKKDSIGLYEVDTHNIIPAWVASDKCEYAAYTFRPKVHKVLGEFLTEFPVVKKQSESWPRKVEPINWQQIRKECGVAQLAFVEVQGGTKAGFKEMKQFFAERFNGYSQLRNDPNANGQSELSPYLHYGNIAPQRVALEAQKYERGNTAAYETFIEELVVRRELSDNFCLYNPEYDSFKGFHEWAQKTLNEHRDDLREYVYTKKQFENAETHDPLWNAAQRQMVLSGKMHGYMRMYWAKKILEWTNTPEYALEVALYLNNKYELDGRDPNGYVGVAWSIGGVHDRAWTERPVYGKIRYMNYNGCKRKFDVDAYIQKWSGQNPLL